jgi:hypothetical protein
VETLMRHLTWAALLLGPALLAERPACAQPRPQTLRPAVPSSAQDAEPQRAPVGEVEHPWTGFDTERYRLRRTEDGYRLELPDGESLAVPVRWLAPPEVLEAEEETYVTSLAWEEEVTAFPIGAGRLGLHLSSYAIQQGGSAAAAEGRDQFLILDPQSRELFQGLDLGGSKGRVRFAGCFSAYFHRIAVGDVDCDRLLDLAVTEERIRCMADENGMDWPVYEVGPMRWYLQRGNGWMPQEELDGRLPCAGLQDVPLLGIVLSPVDFVLQRYAGRAPLLPSRP